MTREDAIAQVLVLIRTPILAMCKPDCLRIEALCVEHNITALELVQHVTRRARQA